SDCNNRLFALTGSALLIFLTAIFYASTGIPPLIKGWHDSMENLKSYGERSVMQNGEHLTPKEIKALALAISTKLEQSGEE
ncbi:c-type cytochrome biogenesis protein CcmI, partial [Pseudoalteromonas sp. S4389]